MVRLSDLSITKFSVDLLIDGVTSTLPVERSDRVKNSGLYAFDLQGKIPQAVTVHIPQGSGTYTLELQSY